MAHPHDLSPIIDQHPFFAGIDKSLRDLLVGCAANELFEPGQFLLREGRAAEKFFLIRAGQVAVEIGVPGTSPIILETLGEGDVLGWSWMVDPNITGFDARATTLVRALSFDGACLKRKMDADPALGYAVMKRFVGVMAHRIQCARLQMLDLYGPRVAKALKKKGG